jgi:hypothetical protein
MRRPNVLDDNLGIAISGLCIFQCLAEPFLKAYVPSLMSWSISDHTHVIIAFWIAFFAYASLAPEALKHCNSHIRIIMTAGALLVLASTIGALMSVPEMFEILLCVFGNGLVIWAHSQNKKLIEAHDALIHISDDHKLQVQSERYYA